MKNLLYIQKEVIARDKPVIMEPALFTGLNETLIAGSKPSKILFMYDIIAFQCRLNINMANDFKQIEKKLIESANKN